MSRLSASRTSRHRQVPPKAGQRLPGTLVIRIEKHLRDTAKIGAAPEKSAMVFLCLIDTCRVPVVDRSVIRSGRKTYTLSDQKSVLALAKRHTGGLSGAFSFSRLFLPTLLGKRVCSARVDLRSARDGGVSREAMCRRGLDPYSEWF